MHRATDYSNSACKWSQYQWKQNLCHHCCLEIQTSIVIDNVQSGFSFRVRRAQYGGCTIHTTHMWFNRHNLWLLLSGQFRRRPQLQFLDRKTKYASNKFHKGKNESLSDALLNGFSQSRKYLFVAMGTHHTLILIVGSKQLISMGVYTAHDPSSKQQAHYWEIIRSWF